MPVRSIAAQNAILDNDYGLTRGPHSPSSHALALFVGDPMTDDAVELDPTDNPGYARVNVPASKWADADNGLKSTNGPVLFPVPTGPWQDEATHWALFDGDDQWDSAPLLEPLAITSAGGSNPAVTLTVFHDDAVLTGP